MVVIINTVNVAVPVSRREAQEIRETSWRTCLTNCAGDTLAIDSYQFKFILSVVVLLFPRSPSPLLFSSFLFPSFTLPYEYTFECLSSKMRTANRPRLFGSILFVRCLLQQWHNKKKQGIQATNSMTTSSASLLLSMSSYWGVLG